MAAMQQTLLMVSNQQQAACDPYYANVSLLLHMDGTNGSTTFLDNSPAPKTVIPSGVAQLSTSILKFGTASYLLNGAGGLTVNNISSEFIFPGDFTIEFWLYFVSTSSSLGLITLGSETTNRYVWFLNSSGTLYSNLYGYSSTSYGTISTSTWNHVAFVRSGSTITCYLNGVSIGNDIQGTIGNGPIIILSSGSANSYMDDLRITKGVARYTSNFTPPTAAFPDVDCSSTFSDPTVNIYPVVPIPTAYTISTDLIPSLSIAAIPTAYTISTDLIPSLSIAAIPTAYTISTDLISSLALEILPTSQTFATDNITTVPLSAKSGRV